MKKKLLAVLLTGAMVASFAGTTTAVYAKGDDDNKLTVWAGIRTQHQTHADCWRAVCKRP